MNDAQWVGIALIVLVLITFFDWIKNWRKGRLKYAIKRTVNDNRPLVQCLLAMYLVVIGLYALPFISQKSVELLLPTDSSLTVIVKLSIPISYLLILIIAAVWMSRSGWKPLLLYTDQEKQWLKESQEKFRSKLPHWLQRFYKILYKGEAK